MLKVGNNVFMQSNSFKAWQNGLLDTKQIFMSVDSYKVFYPGKSIDTVISVHVHENISYTEFI